MKIRHAHARSGLHERIGQCASGGQHRRAFEMLDQLMEDPLPLFQGEDRVLKERHLAWLNRVELLRKSGHLREAIKIAESACAKASARRGNAAK